MRGYVYYNNPSNYSNISYNNIYNTYNIAHTNTYYNKNNNISNTQYYKSNNLPRSNTYNIPSNNTYGISHSNPYTTIYTNTYNNRYNNHLLLNNNRQTQIIIQTPSTQVESNQLIDNTVINIVLSNTIQKYFVLKDFLKLKTEKDILKYFYEKEKICLEWLDQNFPNDDNNKKFFKNLIINSIQQIYEKMEQFIEEKKSIKSKIQKLMEEIINTRNFTNFEENYKKYFGIKNLPKFLTREIVKKIEYIQYIEKYNKYIEEKRNINELNQILIYYYKFIKSEMIPFNSVINNENLLIILIVSNLKDIYKSKKLKKIFLDNYGNISKYFNIKSFDYNKFIAMINNTNINFNENELLNIYFYDYQKKSNSQINIYVLSSFFYLIMNVMKDTNDNYKRGAFLNFKNYKIEINLNNPLLYNILRNVIINFVKYCPGEKSNSNSYYYLLLLLYNYIVMEDNKITNEKNKEYNISNIKYIVNKSLFPEVKNEKIDLMLTKINNIDSPYIKPPKILTKIKQIFLDEEFHENEIDKIELSPLNLKIISNTITIFISGFGSEDENIYSWRNFIDYETKFSNFYYYKWPSGEFAEMVSVIPFSDKFVLQIPQKFVNYKLKAKLVGKILGLFLVSNEDFKKYQINLVGFSLGCQVIKYCIKEISKIKGARNMINNVLFLGGATSISDKKNWKNILKNVVGGRIINCYSKHDFILSKLFKFCVDHTAIGTRELIIKDENNSYNIIENYDLSDLKLGHLSYRKKFGEIMKRINFY